MLRSGFLGVLRLRLRCRRKGHDFVGYLYRPGEVCWRCGKPRALPQARDRPRWIDAPRRPDPPRAPAAQIDEDEAQETFKAFWLASNRYEEATGG
jgi:hypothetical protein